jgi:hypothetical protein
VMIATDDRVRQRPFVAPGRRKLFLDWFAEYEKKQREKPGCLPVLGALDLGLTEEDTQALAKQGLIGGLEDLIAGTNGDLAPGLRATPRLEAVALWSAGCRALDAGRGQDALRDFERAAELAPGGRLYPLSAVLALVRLRRFAEADERIGLVYSEWRDDPRYAVVSALVGSARGDLDKAEAWLRDPAERALLGGGNALLRDLRGGRLSPDVLARLKKEMPEEWQQRLTEALVSEQYYYVLLWRGRYDAARDYALRMADRYRALSLPVWDWQERAADGAFYGKGFDEARGLYEGILEVESRWSVILKLSDLAFFTGDLEGERALRQQYWGVLDER